MWTEGHGNREGKGVNLSEEDQKGVSEKVVSGLGFEDRKEVWKRSRCQGLSPTIKGLKYIFLARNLPCSQVFNIIFWMLPNTTLTQRARHQLWSQKKGRGVEKGFLGSKCSKFTWALLTIEHQDFLSRLWSILCGRWQQHFSVLTLPVPFYWITIRCYGEIWDIRQHGYLGDQKLLLSHPPSHSWLLFMLKWMSSSL